MTLSTVAPVRLQRSRAKGSRLVSPNGLPVVCVSRPSKWGNQYSVVRSGPDELACYYVARWDEILKYCFTRDEATRLAVLMYENALLSRVLPYQVENVRRDLAGKNLSCWCKLGSPCHADVLLRVANGGEP
jgi:hypothetical protein